MKKIDLSNILASEMDKALNSDENKSMFSSSSMLEKLAFKKVSEQDTDTEVEVEMNKVAQAVDNCSAHGCKEEKDGQCKCNCKSAEDCKKGCACHPQLMPTGGENQKPGGFDWAKGASIVSVLSKVSEVLDNNGFEKLAAAAIILADRFIVEAKAKKDSKKSSGKKSSEKPKKKMDVKERMKKMREMKNKGKKSPAKSSPAKSSPAKSSPAKSSPAKSSEKKKSVKKGKMSKSAQDFASTLKAQLLESLPEALKDKVHFIEFNVGHANGGVVVSGKFKSEVNVPNLSTVLGNQIKRLNPQVKETNLIEAI